MLTNPNVKNEHSFLAFRFKDDMKPQIKQLPSSCIRLTITAMRSTTWEYVYVMFPVLSIQW